MTNTYSCIQLYNSTLVACHFLNQHFAKMTTRALVGLSLLGAASALYCDEHNALQWTCHTVTEGEPRTLAGLAAKLHVNPHRFAELNSLGQRDIRTWQVDVGAALRVPFYATCMPRDGTWACYEVQKDGESLAAIAQSSVALWRSDAGLAAARAMNARALFNESDTLFAGMHVRLPIAQCRLLGDTPPPAPDPPGCDPSCPPYPPPPVLPAYHHCFAVEEEGATLPSFAAKHESTAEAIFSINDGVLAGNPVLVVGMVVAVPRAQPMPPSGGCDPSATFKGSHWYCYTVEEGDKLEFIATRFGIDWPKLCAYNRDQISDCMQISAGQVLALPGELNMRCTDVPGQLKCWKYQGADYDIGGIFDRTVTQDPQGDSSDITGTIRGVNGWSYEGAAHSIRTNVSLQVPLRHCLPNATLECVTRAEYNSVMVNPSREFFGIMEIRSIGENYAWEFNSGYVRSESTFTHSAPPDAPSLWPTDTSAMHYRSCATVFGCGASEPSDCPSASVVPGSHFAYKVWFNDTLDHLDKRFGFAEGTLCSFNAVKNCNCLSTEGAWLKVPSVLPEW
jgi:LysM repeat protein